MAQRVNRRSVSFSILPRDSSGDVDVVSNAGSRPTIDIISAGNFRRRRRKKGRKGSMSDSNLSLSGSDVRYDYCPNDRSSFAKPPVPGSGSAILECDETAVGQGVADEVLTDLYSRTRQFSNGALASSSKQLEQSPERDGNGEYFSREQLECSPCEKQSEGELLCLVGCRQGENGISETVESLSAHSTHDQFKDLPPLPSLTRATSQPTAYRTASLGDAFCDQRQNTENSPLASMCSARKDSLDIGTPGLNSEVQESTDITSPWSLQSQRSGLRQRTGHVLEEDSSGFQSTNVLKDFILKDDIVDSNKGVSAPMDERDDQECKQCVPPDLSTPTPVVHTALSQLSELEQLMGGSEPANVAPLKYFFQEVMQAPVIQNTQSAENDKKRQHVYNTMFHVPWRCELLIIVGFFVCLDSFLSLLTVMPLRLIIFLWRCAFNKRQSQRPNADELSDLSSFLVLVLGVTLLQQADISFIYHMIRSQATIKLYVVYNVLEIFDKLCQSFGSDVLQVVLNSAENVATCSTDLLPFEALRFVMDQCIAIVSFIVHSLIILAQSITVSAALRSHNNALFTLLISNNFAEIKSNVFKRLAKDNLHKLAYLDTVERFHITAQLFFVLAQNLLASNEPWLLTFAFNASMVLLCEVLVDSIKHAFLAKFNEIKPAAYSEFLQALCKQTISTQSHDVHKTLSFVPLAPACVVIRVLIPLYAVYLPGEPFLRVIFSVLYSIATFLFLVILKTFIGLALLKHANWYVERCKKKVKYFHAD